MQSGSLVSSDVGSPEVRVTVNLVEREVESVSLTHELVGDLPAPISAVSGISHGSGSIVFTQQKSVTDMGLSPLNASSGWTPKKGDLVHVYEGDGVSEWRVFTGIIDKTSGDTTGGVRADVVSQVDKLNASFRHEPLQRLMPPLTRGAADYRAVGLTHMYFVDAALRAAGFYAVPPPIGRVGVSATLQSSLWPETGTLTRSVNGGISGGPWATNNQGEYALSMGNADATYGTVVSDSRGTPLAVSLTVEADHAGSAFIVLQLGASSLTLAIGARYVQVRDSAGAGLGTLALGAGTRFTFIATGTGFEVRHNKGGVITGTLPFDASSAVLGDVRLRLADAARVSGLQVGFVASADKWAYINHVPTASYDMSRALTWSIMDASPLIETTTVKDFLAGVAESTLSAMWIDETGVMRWAQSLALTAATVAKTITTADDVLALKWVDDAQQERSKITVTYRRPACTRSRYDNILLYQGRGESRESRQETKEFIKPDTDTDWLMTINAPLVLGDPGAVTLANSGYGSITGGILAESSAGAEGVAEQTATGLMSVSFEKINSNTYLYTERVGTLPDARKLFTAFHTYSQSIWRRWWGQGLPIFRGFGKTDWADMEKTITASPKQWAGELTLDLGHWVAREDNYELIPDRVLSYLAQQCTNPAPYVTGLETTIDPRLQVGDVIRIESPTYLGVTFTGLIVGMTRDMSESHTISMDLRMLSMDTTLTTYEAWNAQSPGTLSYDQFAALKAQKYSDFATEN